MKTCTRCHERKSIDDFRWQPSVSSYHSWCRACERAYRSNRSTRRAAGQRNVRRTGRAFGVELELTGPSSSVIQRAVEPITGPLIMRGYASTNGASWELKHDGSVAGNGLELVSPKLYGEAGLEQLKQVLFALQSVGATVDRSCGTHVHIDFRNVDAASTKRQLLGFVLNERLVYDMVAPSRRTNHYAGGTAWNSQQVLALRNMSGSLRDLYAPRGTVNVGSFARHGSVEFRSHGGTTSWAKLSAWITFLFKTLEHNEATSDETVYNTAAEWLDAVGVPAEHKATLLRFQAARERAAEQFEVNDYATVQEVR